MCERYVSEVSVGARMCLGLRWGRMQETRSSFSRWRSEVRVVGGARSGCAVGNQAQEGGPALQAVRASQSVAFFGAGLST